MEIGLQASYQIDAKMEAGIAYNYMGGRNALVDTEVVAMNDIHDVNATVSYKVFDWLHVFGSLRNAINANYDTYYGYKSLWYKWNGRCFGYILKAIVLWGKKENTSSLFISKLCIFAFIIVRITILPISYTNGMNFWILIKFAN